MNRRCLLTLMLAGWCAGAGVAQSPDALDETLALVGLRRGDLGWVPKGWWPRWPTAEYKLRAFDALFAAPLENVTYARGLAQTAWDKLDPAKLDQDTGRGARPLFEAVQRLGIDPKFGGFRGYSVNLIATEVPLEEAILKLYTVAGRDTRGFTFGMDLPYPRVADRLREHVRVLPDGVSPILGQLVLNLIEARRWVDLAFRKVDGNDRLTVATRLNIGEEMIDAVDYCPAFDDVARSWDEASLWYAAQISVDALDLARIKLQAWKNQRTDPPAEFAFEWETPWGWIRVLSHDTHSAVPGDNALLIVSLAGDNKYTGAVAGANPTCPLSLLLDLEGADVYESDAPAQGAGLTGVGILLDAAGDDTYAGQRYAQGVGQFGFGLLADFSGNDKYDLHYSGQGCGYFGVGLLFDVTGDDTYDIWCDGQGLGGVNGVGVLADRTGNDRFVAERKHSITGRPSYHSPGLDVGVSNVQGCGMGRRGDGSDGHSWAGGLGALLDGDGNDYYSAGNWCLGTGYWFGIGVLHDRGGNDEYHGVAYSQGTGAHFCIGVCIDEAGDDQHLAEENSHSSLAWAHDFTIGILLNAAGDDLYKVDGSGMSYSVNRSISMLLDLDGSDRYEIDLTRREKDKAGLHPGFAMNAETFRARDGVGTYFADTTSLGLFLDVGGEDVYPGEFHNDMHRLDPSDSLNWADRNFSVAADQAAGTVSFSPTPMRVPSGPRPSPR